MKKLRILFSSNAVWGISGYSNVMAELLPYVKSLGYPVAMIDYFGLQGGKIELDGVTHYSSINHIYGSDAMIFHAQDFKADVVFALTDQWVLNSEDLKRVNRYIPITPIDYDPVPKSIIQNLRLAYRIITYSKFGQEKLREKGIYSTYIPHTVDTTIFYPMDKKKRKAKTGIAPDSFLIGMVGANKDNPARKCFQEALDAFKLFLKIEPKALLYIHTNPEFPGGFPVHRYAEFLNIKDKVLFPDVYQMNFNMKKKEMNLIYNTFDIYLSPSMSEGFCLPIIEAQAAGVPVITNNWTSMTELIKPGETGFLTDVGYKRWFPNESYTGFPSVPSIVDCLVKLHKSNTIEMGKAGRKFVKENYDSAMIFDTKWRVFLEMLETEIYPPVANSEKKVV